MTPYPSATTPTAAAAGVPSPYPDAHPGARLFRGRSLEALLPLIREALGPDAIVLRRREGLEGGTLGFFQTRFVEVEAIAGEPTALSVLDDGPAWPDDVADDGVRWLDEPAPQAFAAGMLPPAAG
ncbi:MAG: hypothetical protein F2817_17985, partial [Actinobacteria bacterium]|nr:hypothetical protein [Actinomycetota bacterium]